MTHFRTQIYDATELLLKTECAADVGGRPGILYGLLEADHVYVEAHGVTVNTHTEAMARLPLVNLVLPNGRRERSTQLTEFRGTTTLQIEVLVTGTDGQTAAASRDALCDAIETALVASDAGTPTDRWIASGWKLLAIDDEIGQRDGAVLISLAKLSLELEIQDVKTAPEEYAFGGLDIEVATRDPDDDSVEMEVEVDLEEP